MKRVIIFMIIVILLCGCVQKGKTLAEQKAIKVTSTIDDLEMQTEIVTATPTSTVTATVETNNISDLFIDFDTNGSILPVNVVEQKEIKALKKFDFGESQVVNSSTQILTAVDNNGLIYIAGGKDIFVIENNSGEINIFKEGKRIKDEYKSDEFSEFCRYVGVMYIEETLFFIIETESEHFNFNYYIVNSETGKVSENYLNKPLGYYGTKILDSSGHNAESERFDYRFYDVIEDKFYDINLNSLENNSRIITNVVFATQDYILLTNSDNSYEQEGTLVINRNLFFINAKTYELEAIYPLSRNGISNLNIFDYSDGLIYFFENENSEIKTLSPETWELNGVCNFDKQAYFLGYNKESGTLYLKLRYNYEHSCGIEYGYFCFENYVAEGYDIYFEFDIKGREYRITDKVYLKDELGDNIECLNQILDYKMNDYIISFVEDSYEGGLYKSFNFAYKLNDGGMIRLP